MGWVWGKQHFIIHLGTPCEFTWGLWVQWAFNTKYNAEDGQKVNGIPLAIYLDPPSAHKNI